MSKKDLKYFMREQKEEVITVPGPESFKDEDGKVIDFEVKVLNGATVNKINDAYRKRSIATDKKGNPLIYNGEVVWKTEKDSARATRHIIAEALVYPNLKDEKLMEYYGVTEQLKAENQLEWIRQMNACVAQTEETIKGELIYC